MMQTATHPAAMPASAQFMGYVLVPPPDYLLIPMTGAVVILAGLIVAIVLAARIRRSGRNHSREILDSSARLAGQVEQLSAALAVADARLCALAARLDEHSRSTQGAAGTSYNVAIRLARSGASRQELMSACGVTQQEADLVLRLHSTDPSVRAAA
ncbi:MAG TPA: DUF2802 domain-containing protein [Steroidobacteraceae bacterium]|nr:DUF2802 domain-containing protein [Steroidobacteraceae bacterium]